MKIFAFILAFTILALSVMPCMDGGLANNGSTKVEISKTDNHNEHNDTDDCSPFCICSCCSTTISSHTLSFNYFDKLVFLAKKYSAFKSSNYSNVSISIWQPPKLA